jgi:hypothetical protein
MFYIQNFYSWLLFASIIYPFLFFILNYIRKLPRLADGLTDQYVNWNLLSSLLPNLTEIS